MFDVEALIRPGVADDSRRYPGVDDPIHPLPRHIMPLAAPPERLQPHLDHMIPERRDAPRVCRHGVVGEVARHDAFQPFSLFGYALMQAVPHLLFYLCEFGPHTFAHGLPLEQELAAVAFRADMREPQEVESSQPPCPRVRSVRLRVTSERDQAGFLRVQFQPKLCQPFPQIVEEPASVRLVLEADDCVIRVADNDRIPAGMTLAPLLHPQVIDVVQIDVRQQR